jgi:excisionase family DNA binding protein
MTSSTIVGSPNLTVEELADEFRTSTETVHYWIKTGKAPRSFKVGRRRLFAREDVNAWLEAAKRVPA